MASESGGNGGIGFFGLLTIVFITLKLCHVIEWSWWYVLAPIWGPFVIVFCAGVVYFIYLLGKAR